MPIYFEAKILFLLFSKGFQIKLDILCSNRFCRGILLRLPITKWLAEIKYDIMRFNMYVKVFYLYYTNYEIILCLTIIGALLLYVILKCLF